MKKILAALLAVTAMSTSAFAKGGGNGGAYLGLSGYYGLSKEYQTTPSSLATDYTGNMTSINGKLGYIMTNGLYVGAIYENDSGVTSNTVSGTTTKTTETVSGYGASIGYFSNYVYVMAHYLTGFTDNTGSSSGVKYTGGTGYQADLGFMFPVASHFALGAEMAWRSITYTKYTSNTQTTSADANMATGDYYPKIVFSFMF